MTLKAYVHIPNYPATRTGWISFQPAFAGRPADVFACSSTDAQPTTTSTTDITLNLASTIAHSLFACSRLFLSLWGSRVFGLLVVVEHTDVRYNSQRSMVKMYSRFRRCGCRYFHARGTEETCSGNYTDLQDIFACASCPDSDDP